MKEFAMKHLFLCIAALPFLVQAQTLTLISPKNGDHHFQRDTVVVNFSADSAYMLGSASGGGTGAVIEISVAGQQYKALHPLGLKLGNNTVPLDDSLWGRVSVVIPDSVQINIVTPAYMLSTASDSVLIRVRDYGHPSIKTVSNLIHIAPGPAHVDFRPPSASGKMHDAIRISNGIITSDRPLRSLAYFTLAGSCVRRIFPINGTVLQLYKGCSSQEYLVECGLADNTRTTFVLRNIR